MRYEKKNNENWECTHEKFYDIIHIANDIYKIRFINMKSNLIIYIYLCI